MNFYESNIGKRVSYKAATIDNPFFEKNGIVLSCSEDAVGNPVYIVDNGDSVYCDKCVIKQ